MSCLQVLVGLKGTTEELGLIKRNYWVFKSNEPERCGCVSQISLCCKIRTEVHNNLYEVNRLVDGI